MRAFSLVELSIVLVILGLLTGGILAGQSLIRAAELRSISTEYQRHVTAVQTFRDKYMAIPGDMDSATRFWNRQVNQTWCAGHSGATVAAPGTCNGNAKGSLDSAGAASQSGEIFQFWKQLALAGLIEGSYTGLAGSLDASHAVIGENIPAARLSNSGWYSYYYGPAHIGSATVLAGYYGNLLFVGRSSTNSWPSGRILTPEEQWGIDVKMDDGKPARGKLVTFWWDDCGTGGSETDYNADYDLLNKTVQCTPVFREAF